MFNFYFNLSSSADWIQAFIAFFQLILSGFGIYYVIKTFKQGNKNLAIANRNIEIANENQALQQNVFKNAIRPNIQLTKPLPEDIPDHTNYKHIFVFTVTDNDAYDVNFLVGSTEYMLFCGVKSGRVEHSWSLPRMKIGERLSMYIQPLNIDIDDYHLYLLKSRKPEEFMARAAITYTDALGNMYIQRLNSHFDSLEIAELTAPQEIPKI